MFDPANPIPRWTVSTMQRVATEPTLARAAIRFANLGIPVFPCVPGGKQPLTPNGFHDATSSARVVHHWWQRTPEANIGLPTGANTGILVVDIDVHDGGSGFAAFERARSEGLADSWGWMVRTPSGGIHVYYPALTNYEQRSWQVPSAHVDFRGDGGYVVAPPSHIEVDGVLKTYDVIAVTAELANPVDAVKLRQFLEPPRPTPPAPPSGLPREVPPRGSGESGRPDPGRRPQPSALLGVLPNGGGRPASFGRQSSTDQP
jgi:hypothetical protein